MIKIIKKTDYNKSYKEITRNGKLLAYYELIDVLPKEINTTNENYNYGWNNCRSEIYRKIKNKIIFEREFGDLK